MRRWRGMIDVPLTEEGRRQAKSISIDLDAVYHDRLQRCVDTAKSIKSNVQFESDGPLPWDMGELFEGREITEDSLHLARYYIQNPHGHPPRGETFHTWTERWMGWLQNLKLGFAAVGIVTHNRNIQYLYSLYKGKFHYNMYDVNGPNFCTVHFYDNGNIAPWGGVGTPNGIYLIRHGETEFGT